MSSKSKKPAPKPKAKADKITPRDVKMHLAVHRKIDTLAAKKLGDEF